MNPQPTVLETAALPFELLPHILVEVRGFEPRSENLTARTSPSAVAV